MNLAVEKHEGNSLWLVIIPSPNEPSVRLAKFADEMCAEVWKHAHNAAQLVAREVGRLEL